MAEQKLKGRVAVVTGGGSGIGAACVAALATAGADVLIFDHGDTTAGEAAAAPLRQAGRRISVFAGDVGDEASVEAAFDQARRELGVVDILVNSAGINMSGVNVADMALDQWERMLRTDLTGSFLTCRRCVRDLKAAGRPGAIVNITSIHAEAMRAGGADYDAAKGGQRNLTYTLALETAGLGITVNAVAPGMILTPMNAGAQHDPAALKAAVSHIPLGRAGKAEEVADLVVFLASPKAAYITGASVIIDGGLSLQTALGA